jgi:hypothetical protein
MNSESDSQDASDQTFQHAVESQMIEVPMMKMPNMQFLAIGKMI